MSDIESPLWVQSSMKELTVLRRRDSITLLVGEREASVRVLRDIGRAFAREPRSITGLVLSEPPATSERDVRERIAGHRFLYDLEVLCWRAWRVLDPVRLLRTLSRNEGVVAVWPGSIAGALATFSAPGRQDHVECDVSGTTVLRTFATRFPDEVPFSTERIP